jgi:predicted GTPase
MSTELTKVVILGAAGRDFHDFNMLYRDDPTARVVAFTAAQIPGISGRRYPAELAGPRYPQGIPIVDENELEALARVHRIDRVVFAYSDVPHEHVMHLASRALAMGADFLLPGPEATMLRSLLPVIAVSAVRTGCGKSAASLWLARRLRARGLRVAVLRHPMPYGDLLRERVQRFATLADLDAADCTIEEREEYEPHLAAGNVVFAGVDYTEILGAAEVEADIIIWEGGNNDFPFIRPNLHIVLADALRPEQVTTHHPGETVARMADVLVINKADAAPAADVEALSERLRAINPQAPILHAAAPVHLDDAAAVAGRRVLVIEDGPTITHGGMAHGAGLAAARAAGAAMIVDPRGSVPSLLAEVFERYPHIGTVLPAMGYGAAQLAALQDAIARVEADIVVAATPVNLARLLRVKKRIVRASYEFTEAGKLAELVDAFLARLPPPR